jgi:SAM-dependent methyltransferase
MRNQDKVQVWLEKIRSSEELANARKMNEWLLPWLKSHLPSHPPEKITLLSVGYGFGADVDTLVDAGVNAYGIEPFARTEMWHLRKNKGRLVIADGRVLPFKNEIFDVVYLAQVLEHVGYEDPRKLDAYSVQKEREKFAKEVSRVLKPDSLIIITTVNRHFCLDTGHGANFLGLRLHSPFNDFTLSVNDIKALFLYKGGGNHAATLPYKSFITWSLYVQNYYLIRLLHPLIKAYLVVLDNLHFLRSSFLSPYLMLAINKERN